MIDSVIPAGLFIGCEIPGIFHDHDHRLIPRRIRADRAQFLICQGKALLAVTYFFSGVEDRFGQFFDLILRHVHNVKRKPLGRFASDSGEIGQLFDQPVHFFAIIIHTYLKSEAPKASKPAGQF